MTISISRNHSSNNNNKADSKQRQTLSLLSSPKRENRITFSSYVYIQNFNWKAEIERDDVELYIKWRKRNSQ